MGDKCPLGAPIPWGSASMGDETITHRGGAPRVTPGSRVPKRPTFGARCAPGPRGWILIPNKASRSQPGVLARTHARARYLSREEEPAEVC